MSNHVTSIYGATISHDFLGLTAQAEYGEQAASFTSELNPKSGFSVEPSALQQAIQWAKEQNKAAAIAKKTARDASVEQAVAVAVAKNKPSPAKEGTKDP